MGLSTELGPTLEEMNRLPTLLRLLSSSRPLSSIPTFRPQDEKEATPSSGDRTIDHAVDRLEDRACIYTQAEGVEVVACHLAPAVCRGISRLPPLEKDPKDGKIMTTAQLAAVISVQQQQLQQQGSQKAVRKRSKKGKSKLREEFVGVEDSLHYVKSDDEPEGMEMSDDEDAEMEDAQKANGKADTAEDDVLVIEDSQEASVTKTLNELVSLVVQAHKTPAKEDDRDGQPVDIGLNVDDSFLAEARQVSSAEDSAGGAMVGSDLGSTLACLMHHASVLNNADVAVSRFQKERR